MLDAKTVQAPNDKNSKTAFESDVASIEGALGSENCIDVLTIARANGRRFASSRGEPSAVWESWVNRLKTFINLALRHDYPVRFFRNTLPTRVVSSSQQLDFKLFARELLRVVSSDDSRTAYWYIKNMSVYKAVVDLPLASQAFATVSARPSPVPGPNSDPVSSHKQLAHSTHQQENNPMGSTFDLVSPDPLKRYLFQYWVYDTETDEIAAEGSFIAKGDTVQEATRHLMESMRVKLGSTASPSHKLHVKMVDTFTKVPASSTKSLAEQFVEAMRAEFKSEASKP